MMRRGLAAGVVGSVLVGFVACSSFEEDATSPGPDAGTASDAGGGSPETSTIPGESPFMIRYDGPPQVMVGESVEITVSVERNGNVGFAGPVHVAIEPLAEISASAIDIVAAQTSGKMTIATTSARKHGRVAITLTGTSSNTTAKAVASYTLLVRGPAGSVDTGFGDNGLFTLSEASGATGLIVANGKIFVGGQIGSDVGIVSLREDGTPDPAFAAAGIFRTSVGTIASTQGLVDTAGGPVIGATVDTGAIKRAVLVGATTTGIKRTGFGTNGVANVPLQTGTSIAASPQLQGILVGGQAVESDGDSTVVRMSVDGKTAELTYSQYSDCPYPPGSKKQCTTNAIAPYVLTGQFASCVARGDGAWIAVKSVTGTALLDNFTNSPLMRSCSAMAYASQGKLYVGDLAHGTAAVLRYNGTAVDDTWSNDGDSTVAAPAAALFGPATALLVQTGSVLVGATADVRGFGIWRVLPDGTHDLSFNGTSYASRGAGTGALDVKGIGVDADGRILLAGHNGHMVVTRFWQ